MDEWFTMCDHCRVQCSSSSDTTLLPSPTDGKLNVRCSLCKLICSYQIEDENMYRTPPPTSRRQRGDCSGISGHSQGDQSSSKGISSAFSGLSLSGRQYAVSQMSTALTYDDKDVTPYNDKDATTSKFGEDNLQTCDHRTLRKMKYSSERINELKKKYVIAESVSPEMALQKVNAALATWSEEAQNYRFRMPGKTKDLYRYDDTLGQICRVRRDTYLVLRQKSLRLGQLLTVIKGLLRRDTFLRVRLLHYMYPHICQSTTPELSMQLLRDSVAELTVLLEVTRESLHLTASPQGVTAGPAILSVEGKELLDCNLGGTTGNLIPCEVEAIDKITPTADIEFVLLVEKDTIFQYLTSRNFYRKNNCLLISGGGVPDIYTRILLRKYYDLLGVPIYALMDGNPSGAQIFCLYCFGSSEKAHENLFLTVRELDYIGLFVKDISKENRTALSDDDKKTLSSLLDKDYIDAVEGLRDNLVWMYERNTKADIEMIMREQSLESYIQNKIQKVKDRKNV